MKAPDCRELLARGIAKLGFGDDVDLLMRLVRYIDEIELWNPRLKLVAASGAELASKHILDSLAGAVVLARTLAGTASGPAGHRGVMPPLPARIADVGAGAGLPGIPIAIAFPQTGVDLVERSGRRAGFLRNAVAATRCANATVHHLDAADFEGPVDLSIHRAFTPLAADVVEMLARPLKPGGAIVAYKGRGTMIEAELDRLRDEWAAADSDEAHVTIVPVRVPFLDDERHLVILRPHRTDAR